MPSSLYIVGAGGFGRELFNWIKQHPDSGKAWNFAGFLDDNADALKGFDHYQPGVVGSVMGYKPKAGEVLLCSISVPKIKRPIVEDLQKRGAEFISFVHPRATVGGNVRIGMGTIICPGVVVTCDVTLGDFVLLNVNSTVGHDAKVGHYVTAAAHTDVTGFCTVGDGVTLGSHAHLIPHSKVGDGATVGAGACVVTPVEAGTTVVGNPATKLR